MLAAVFTQIKDYFEFKTTPQKLESVHRKQQIHYAFPGTESN